MRNFIRVIFNAIELNYTREINGFRLAWHLSVDMLGNVYVWNRVALRSTFATANTMSDALPAVLGKSSRLATKHDRRQIRLRQRRCSRRAVPEASIAAHHLSTVDPMSTSKRTAPAIYVLIVNVPTELLNNDVVDLQKPIYIRKSIRLAEL